MDQPQKRNNTFLVIILLVAGGALLICTLCAAVILLNRKGLTTVIDDAKATAVAREATMTPTPLPTQTLRPTQTPAPTKVLTIEPAEAPVTEPPPAVQLYALEFSVKMMDMAEALDKIGELSQDPKLDDQGWIEEINTQMDKVRQAHKDLAAMENIPPEMSEIHAAVLAATAEYNQAMEYLETGINNLSVEDLLKAKELILSSNDKLEKAAGLLNAYLAQFE